MRKMTFEERTWRYTARRIAELRGAHATPTLDPPTRRYIHRRLAELRGAIPCEETAEEHPYIRRRLRELRTKINETKDC